MKSISLFIYSFQNNELINVIKDIIKKSSKKTILSISIIDQNSINQYKKFNIRDKNVYINYKHRPWDVITSPIKYKKDFVDSINTDYSLFCGDGITFSENWDLYLIDSIMDNMIFSSNYTCNLITKNGLLEKTNRLNINSLVNTGIIDRDFIFSKTDLFKKISWPIYLKYYGEEECLSISFKNIGCDIYAIPTSIYINNTKKLKDYDYVPFSLTHNYNLFINKINKNNTMHNIFNLDIIDYEENDVEYDPFESQFNKIAGERYLNKTRSID